jgi:very-short-patch-repair endonuclease
MDNKRLFNKKNLKPFRASLRRKSTSAEGTLWKHLKSRNLEGRKFRRQQSIGKYIVDFYCPSEKLIIELDGDPHGDPARIHKDIQRDNYLKELGLTILRFENRFVFQEPELLLNEIKKYFKKED